MIDTDVQNVNAIQDKMIVMSLSESRGNTITSPSTVTQANASKEIPFGPQPTLIGPTGIKIFDDIC
jgi:hypothetical protein